MASLYSLSPDDDIYRSQFHEMEDIMDTMHGPLTQVTMNSYRGKESNLWCPIAQL